MANDDPLVPDPPTAPYVPLYWLICQSPRTRRLAAISAFTVGCVCEACNAEFALSPQREYRRP
jgi:alkanesulfonate monooxygenase SsuD/methylene tetrahydromethanopterin reductase-like flavin-dependent oxidoreductase (luciferase family)